MCTPGFQNAGTAVSLCEYPCATSTNCTDPGASCQNVAPTGTAADNVCFQDLCDVDAGAGGLVFGGPFFNSCASTTASDGQCLAFNGGTFAECFQTGTAAPGAACDFNRGGTSSLCTPGNICVPGSNTTDPAIAGRCMPLDDGGANCTGLQLMFFGGADWDLCAPVCGDAGTPPISCTQTGFTCQALGATGPFACLPQ